MGLMGRTVAREKTAISPVPCNHYRPAGCDGFTLLELLVVLSIMAISIGLVLPLVADRFYPNSLAHTGQQLVSSLERTRSRAIRYHKTESFTVNVDERYFQAGDNEPRSGLPDQVKVTLSAARQWMDKQSGIIRFYPDGSSSGGKITMEHAGEQYQVDVNWLTGSVSMSVPQGREPGQ